MCGHQVITAYAKTPTVASLLYWANWETTFGLAHIALFCGKLVLRNRTNDAKIFSPIEGDSNGYSAYVPELPTILVTADSIEELTARAKEAIRIYWESLPIDRSTASMLREIEVEVELPV